MEREILLKYFEKGDKPITATEIKHLIENKKYPLKMNIYQLTRELKRLFGEPTKPKRENGKIGRYYYVTTDFSGLGENLQSYDQLEKSVELLPF